MKRIQKEIDSMFQTSFRDFRHPLIDGSDFRMPLTDVEETENSITATFELPGAKKDEIQLNVTPKEIEVKVEQKQEKQGSYTFTTRQYYRKLPLLTEINPERAEAKYENGVLEVKMPKMERIDSKKRLQIQ